MSNRSGLLDYAEQVLDGTVSLESSGPRTAALLARCALEEWLDAESASWHTGGYPYPSTKSKLVALEALTDRERGARAQQIWNALSRAVHHHAYELQPSAAEVRYLVTQVRRLEKKSGTS